MGTAQSKQRRVLVIGLDCAAPELVFERWRDELPTFRRLMVAGMWGRLKSCTPPITVPAWMSMMTSKDPGTLGIYGFRNRHDFTYKETSVANSTLVKEPILWEVLARCDKKVVLVGIPLTYPPRPVNGYLITCFLTPSTKSPYTYPVSLKQEIEALVGEYLFDVRDFRTEDKDSLLRQIYAMTDKRFKVVDHLLQTKPWDFFMFVEMGVDRIHHGLWKFMDHAHWKYPGFTPYEHAIRDYYKYLDHRIASLLEKVGDETIVLVVSDHGAKKMDGGICLNEWLIREGYLVLKSQPTGIVNLEPAQIDWQRTKAWGAGGYYGRIFLNVRGRELQGCVAPEAYEALRDELITKLEALGDHEGRPIGTRVLKPQETYHQVRNIPPDLIALFGDLYWRSVGTIGHGTLHVFDNDTGPDDANHAQHGLFILYDPQAPANGWEVEGAQLLDIAPTVLEALSIPVPTDMQGRSLHTLVRVHA
jgi:predicted AlkP superfamily phosphohydrolase/phosphomutase